MLRLRPDHRRNVARSRQARFVPDQLLVKQLNETTCGSSDLIEFNYRISLLGWAETYTHRLTVPLNYFYFSNLKI
jgi:hypothetical protein